MFIVSCKVNRLIGVEDFKYKYDLYLPVYIGHAVRRMCSGCKRIVITHNSRNDRRKTFERLNT